MLTDYLQIPGWNRTTLTREIYQQQFEQNLTQYNVTGLERQFRHCSMEEDLEKVGVACVACVYGLWLAPHTLRQTLSTFCTDSVVRAPDSWLKGRGFKSL